MTIIMIKVAIIVKLYESMKKKAKWIVNCIFKNRFRYDYYYYFGFSIVIRNKETDSLDFFL